MRYGLTDYEWVSIKPFLPNKPRGVARVDDRRVLNGIFWRLRTGAPWADIPERYGPHTTCVNRFNRWRKALGHDTMFRELPTDNERHGSVAHLRLVVCELSQSNFLCFCTDGNEAPVLQIEGGGSQ